LALRARPTINVAPPTPVSVATERAMTLSLPQMVGTREYARPPRGGGTGNCDRVSQSGCFHQRRRWRKSPFHQLLRGEALRRLSVQTPVNKKEPVRCDPSRNAGAISPMTTGSRQQGWSFFSTFWQAARHVHCLQHGCSTTRHRNPSRIRTRD